MTTSLASLSWPVDQVGEAMDALGAAARLAPERRLIEAPPPTVDLLQSGELAAWIEATATWLSLDAEAVHVRHVDLTRFLRAAGPALLCLPGASGARVVAVVRGGGRNAELVGPEGVRGRVPVAEIGAALGAPLEGGVGPEIDRLLEHTVAPERRAGARAAMVRERLANQWIPGCWLLRASPSAALGVSAWRAGLPRRIGWMLAAHAFEYGLMLMSWWAVARGALQGRFDPGWLVAWIVMLASAVPFALLTSWHANRFAVEAGTLLRTRVLRGALHLDPNSLRHQGVGQLLGRVLESSAVETLGVAGGLTSLVSLVEIGLCTAVLANGAAGRLHAVLFGVLVVASIVQALRYLVRRRAWTQWRLALTHDLVERMVGHRTRVTQQTRSRWHDGEDETLDRYLADSVALDHTTVLLSLVPRAWMLIGIAGIAAVLADGSAGPEHIVVTLGGVLLGHRALSAFVQGLASLVGARVAWAQVGPVLRAAEQEEAATAPRIAAHAQVRARGDGTPLLDAHDLVFRHPGRSEAVLNGCSLHIALGDRLLLEGASGGGKSTLGSLLTGLRSPDGGLLLLGGLDRHTLGETRWRRRVVAAPQFHENYVFGASVAFNLLMGRNWPPSPDDLDEAEAVCRELDLGDLLDRMPEGLQQMVGETGWQLSHGERSRIYIARALLQPSDLIVLDESFAALDPDTLQRALACVLQRARTLLVIAHP